MSAQSQSTPSPLVLATHHKFKKNPKFFLHRKLRTSASAKPPPFLSAKCSHWTNPLPLTADDFYGQPLFFLSLCRLLDDTNITTSEEHMWCVPFSSEQNCTVEINFVQATLITGFRVWNYNTSFEDGYKGVSVFTCQTLSYMTDAATQFINKSILKGGFFIYLT